MKSLLTLDELANSNSGDIFSNNSDGLFDLFSFVDLEALEVNNSNNPFFNIDSSGITLSNADLYINDIDFTGHSKITIGGSSKFKRIISNQITASFDVNNLNNNIIESGDGITATKGTGQYLLESVAFPSPINNTAYVNRANWNTNYAQSTTSTYQMSDYQQNVYFDLEYRVGQNEATISKNNPETLKILLPENFSVGNVVTITFSKSSTFQQDFWPSDFNILFEKQGSVDAEIIPLTWYNRQMYSQRGDNAFNTKHLNRPKLKVNSLSSVFSINLLYLGNNFFNFKHAFNPLTFKHPNYFSTSYLEVDILTTSRQRNQWLILDF